uniref:TonB C-terminal domain-containing protein n=1 Tax=Eiseniibacteriota bacterium TaxID=2212470 RepID=A0A832I465_UNCEI
MLRTVPARMRPAVGAPRLAAPGRAAARCGRAVLAAAAAAFVAAGCERGAGAGRGEPMSLPVRVTADTGRAERLRVVAPPARDAVRVWVARVSPARPAPPDAPLPAAEAPLALPADDAPPPPGLEVDEDLRPPILRTPAALVLPGGPGRARVSVELDVRVDEEGAVSDALWAGGSDDSALVAAATASALGMRFHPALQAGRPIAVWCRQRFDFGPRRAPRGARLRRGRAPRSRACA